MDYRKLISVLQQFKREMPTLVGNEMVNYALDNMRAEGIDGKPWPRRKAGAARDEGRRLLIDTGQGERSIRIVRKNSAVVEVAANEYMEAHNTGATINTTANVRSHTRTRAGRTEQVSAHTRQVNFTLPQRTFLAPTDALFKRIQNTLLTRFKQLTS